METNNFLLISIFIFLLYTDILLLNFLVQPLYACLQFSHFIMHITFYELQLKFLFLMEDF